MIGTKVMSSGIEYHERHTVMPDGRLPPRFGNPLEVPEDLLPIPADRPTTVLFGHPIARYLKVYEPEDAPSLGKRRLEGVIFVDTETGTVIQLAEPVDEEGNVNGPAPCDVFGTPALRVLTDHIITIKWDEEAIRRENDRRLKKALEIQAMYVGVTEAHEQRIAAEKAAREQLSPAQQQILRENEALSANVTFPSPTPPTTEAPSHE